MQAVASMELMLDLPRVFVYNRRKYGGYGMKEIEKIRDQVVSELTSVESKDDRFRELVKKGKEMPALEDSAKEDKFLIKGCMSKAWLVPKLEDGRVFFAADSEATIVKGIISVLVRVYSGHSPDDILSLDPSFLRDAGIEEALSMNRRSGLSNMIKQINLYAAAYKAILQS